MHDFELVPPMHPDFFFNDTATTEIYTLSLHDALPISEGLDHQRVGGAPRDRPEARRQRRAQRSEEHTSELQSPDHLVCRLLLEKKKQANEGATETVEVRVLGDTLRVDIEERDHQSGLT